MKMGDWRKVEAQTPRRLSHFMQGKTLFYDFHAARHVLSVQS
jgi:hypothetical protein